MAQTPEFSRMILTFVAIFLMYQIDFKDATNLMFVRIGYGIVQLLTFGVILYIYVQISKSTKETKETKETNDKKKKNNTTPQPKVLIPASSSWFSPSTPEEEMTIEEYDFFEWKKFLNQTFMSTLITVGIHYQWEIAPPLLMQAVMGISSLLGNPLVKIHLLGKTIPRPWKEESLLSSFQDVVNQPDSAANEEIAAEIPSQKQITTGEDEKEEEEKKVDDEKEKKKKKKKKKVQIDEKEDKKEDEEIDDEKDEKDEIKNNETEKEAKSTLTNRSSKKKKNKKSSSNNEINETILD